MNNLWTVYKLYNVNTRKYEYELFVRIVKKEYINFEFDKYIGTVEYKNGKCLSIWCVDGILNGYWLKDYEYHNFNSEADYIHYLGVISELS